MSQLKFETDLLEPCLCGFKPDHYTVGYGRTPYVVWCPNCKKQTNMAMCLVTESYENVIDYWNKVISKQTLEQVQSDKAKFYKRAEKEIRENEYKYYEYYWFKGYKRPKLFKGYR